jgi:hypothetical protein
MLASVSEGGATLDTATDLGVTLLLLLLLRTCSTS